MERSTFLSIGLCVCHLCSSLCVFRQFAPLIFAGSRFYFIGSLLRSDSMGPTETNGIPESRTFFSSPCSAAWSSTGPVRQGVAVVRRGDGHAAEPVRPLKIHETFDPDLVDHGEKFMRGTLPRHAPKVLFEVLF